MLKLCECGCGRTVKNRFVSGHNNNRLSIKLTNEHKQKISKANKGKRNSISTEFKKGHVPWNKARLMENGSWNKGIPMRDKTKQLIREKALKQFKNGMPEETKRKISLANKGRPRSEKFKLKISKLKKGNKYNLGRTRPHSDKTKMQMRKSAIKRIERRKLNNLPLIPNMGKYEKQILDNLEENFYPFKILRQYKVAGYFLDGYAPAFKLAIEVDELYHKTSERLSKDRYREKQIKNELGCTFLRMETIK